MPVTDNFSLPLPDESATPLQNVDEAVLILKSAVEEIDTVAASLFGSINNKAPVIHTHTFEQVEGLSDLRQEVFTARDEAVLARDASLAIGPKYATEALGRAAVANGGVFFVQGSGEVAAFEYRRNDANSSVLIATYPSKAAVDAFDEKLAAINSNINVERLPSAGENPASLKVLTPSGRLVRDLNLDRLLEVENFERLGPKPDLAVLDAGGRLVAEIFPSVSTIDFNAATTLANARIDDANARIDAISLPSYRMETAHNLMLKLGQIKAGVVGAQAHFVAIGDSYTETALFYLRELGQMLFGEYGNGGLGYIDLAAGSPHNVDPNIVRTRSGFTIVDQTVPAPSLYLAKTVTAGAYVTLEVPVGHTISGAKLIFNATTNGQGRYRWNDTDTWTTISVTGAGMTGAALTGFPTDSSAFKFRFESVSGDVQIAGIHISEVATGVVLSKCGNSGSRAQDWATVSQTELAAGFSQFPVDAFMIYLGTNDSVAQYGVAAYAAYIRTLIATLKSSHPAANGLPAPDIILCPSADVLRTPAIDMKPYLEACLEIGGDLNLPVINLHNVFGPNPTDKVAWFDGPGIHPAPGAGSVLIAHHIFKQLK